jgi:signal transduction histidine kinase
VAAILIAESARTRGPVGAALRDAGHDTVEVITGADALDRLDDGAFELVLLDDEVGEPGYLDTCRALRTHPHGSNVPVVVRSARAAVIVTDLIAAGGDDVVPRSLHPHELDQRIRVAIAVFDARRNERLAGERMLRRCEELARSAAQKEALTEFLVHDLKSPLASLTITLQELLVRGAPDGWSVPLRSCLSATDVAGRMVMNLLDLSQARRLEVRAGNCGVEALFAHLRDHFALRFELRGVGLHTHSEISELWADRDLLRRVAENLIDNALRYTGSGTTIEVDAHATDDGALLTVIDRGPGVAHVHRERIFDRFVQLDPHAAHRASRGLGLAFCRLAVDAHGGRIWVDEAPGGGARFRAMFPGPGGRRC